MIFPLYLSNVFNTNRQPKSSRSFCTSKLYSCQVSILCGIGGIKDDRRWGRGWWRGDYSAFCFWVTTPSSLPLLLACFETFFFFFTFFITFLFLHSSIHHSLKSTTFSLKFISLPFFLFSLYINSSISYNNSPLSSMIK